MNLSARRPILTSVVFGTAGLATVLGLFVFARPLVDSLIIAGLLAFLLDPLVRLLQNRLGLSRASATTIVFIGSLLLLSGAIVLIGAVLWDQVQRFRTELITAWQEFIHQLAMPYNFLGFRVQPQLLVEDFQQAFSNTLSTLVSNSGIVLGRSFDNVLWSTVVLVSLYYFLKDGAEIKPWILEWLPASYQSNIARLLDEINTAWSVFLRMQLLIAMILILLSVVSTSLIIWLYGSGWLPISGFGLLVLLLIVYTGVQQVDNIWLRPQLMGRALKLHPGVVFVGLVAGLALTGVLGALLAVPLIATIKIIGRHVRAHLLGESPWPPSKCDTDTTSVVSDELESCCSEYGTTQR